MAGVPALREIIAEKSAALYGTAYDPEHEVTVVPGATYGIFTAVSAFVRPGDEVIVPAEIANYVPTFVGEAITGRPAIISGPSQIRLTKGFQ